MRRAVSGDLLATLMIVLLVAGQAECAVAMEGTVYRGARPTPEQVAWQDAEIGMFIHFAPNTWSDKEGDDLSVSLDRINPRDLDVKQWVRVAKSMGARYIVFVAKHVGGFCMWQTETTDYGIRGTPWRDGKGDVLGELAAECRRQRMRLGVYLSPRDDNHGAGTSGKCADPAAQSAYNELYHRQLTEVLSRYGSLFEVWFDGSVIVDVGDILRRYAQHAAVFQGRYATIRWVGNEAGLAPYPCWNGIAEAKRIAGGARAIDSDPDADSWLPSECDVSLRRDWFWNSTNEGTIKNLDALMEIYYRSVGRGAGLLLNVTPDTSGRIPDADERRVAEFGAEVRRRFGRPLARAAGTGDCVEIDLSRPRTIDHAISMEDIREGERVRRYTIEGETEAGWRELTAGTAIGHKKIDRFEPVTCRRVRLRVLATSATPIVRRFAVYRVGIKMDAISDTR